MDRHAIGAGVLAVLFFAGPSFGRHGVPSPTACPRGSGYPDGCALASVITGSVQHPDFFNGYANQSGQTYLTRPPWNVAGVDYAVGVYTPQSQLKDPTVNANLPSGCAFSNGTVNCTGTTSVDISGFDFSRHGGTKLYIHSGYAGICTVENNYFLVTSATDGNAPLVRIDAAACSRVVQWNTFDGNYNSVTDGLTTYLWGSGGGNPTSEIVQYNAWLRCPQKCISHSPAANVISQFNYADGLEEGPSHGEWDIYANGAGNIVDSFNTILQPANVPDVAPNPPAIHGITTLLYFSQGQAGSIGSVTSTNNTLVTNTKDGSVGGGGSTSAVVELSYSTYGFATFVSNYIDATGSLFCYMNASSPTFLSQPSWTGDIDMTTNTRISQWGGACPSKASH